MIPRRLGTVNHTRFDDDDDDDDDDFIRPIAHRVIAALNTSRTSSFVHHPACSHARRRRRRAHFRTVRRAEHCRVRTRATERTRSVVVVHSFGVIRSDM